MQMPEKPRHHTSSWAPRQCQACNKIRYHFAKVSKRSNCHIGTEELRSAIKQGKLFALARAQCVTLPTGMCLPPGAPVQRNAGGPAEGTGGVPDGCPSAEARGHESVPASSAAAQPAATTTPHTGVPAEPVQATSQSAGAHGVAASCEAPARPAGVAAAVVPTHVVTQQADAPQMEHGCSVAAPSLLSAATLAARSPRVSQVRLVVPVHRQSSSVHIFGAAWFASLVIQP